MLRNWGIRRKILAGFGFALLLIALVLAWAVYNLLQLGRASEAILSENYSSILAAENMIDALERQDSSVPLFILGFEEEGTAQFEENERRFLQWSSHARDNVTIEGEDEIIARIDSTYAAYLSTFARFMQTSAATGRAQQYHDALLPAFAAVRQSGVDLRNLNQQAMYEASEAATRVSHGTIWSTTAVGLIAIFLALAFSLVLADRIVWPIRTLQEAAAQIAEGRYEVEVPSSASDELGHLTDQFNVMAARLKSFHELNVEQLIAEKRKSEAIIRSIDDGIIAVGTDLSIVDINLVAARVLGVEAEDVRGQPFREVLGEGRLSAYVRKTLETGRPPKIGERDSILTLRTNGREVYYEYLLTPVRTPAGGLLGAILLLRDVTRMKELDRLKSEFVAIASHELQTPLTSIAMSIGLLGEHLAGRLNAPDLELLEVASEEIDRLRSLVCDLLDLSKIEAGKIELQFDSVPVSFLMKKAVEALRSQAEDRFITIESEAESDHPRAHADANKITWVLTNLISNALRYTNPGGHVRVSARQAGGRIHLSVSDDGAGIPLEYQSKIFEKFVQVKDYSGNGGSGLGLAICKEIVRAHGGTIWVKSTPGAGSTFTFTLRAA